MFRNKLNNFLGIVIQLRDSTLYEFQTSFKQTPLLHISHWPKTPKMCYFPAIRMACGHHEDFRIILHCPPSVEATPSYNFPEEVAVEASHVCNEICRRSLLSIQAAEACSGAMCGSCRVATGKRLDYLVRDMKKEGLSFDKLWVMSGGLHADSAKISLQNTMGNLVRDVDTAIEGSCQNRMKSDRQCPDFGIDSPDEMSSDSEYTIERRLVNGATSEKIEPDGLPRENSGHAFEDMIVGWLRESESHNWVSERYQSDENFLDPILKPNITLERFECSSCQTVERSGTLLNFKESTHSLNTFDQSTSRNWSFIPKLQFNGVAQNDEAGMVGGIGWMCCEKMQGTNISRMDRRE